MSKIIGQSSKSKFKVNNDDKIVSSPKQGTVRYSVSASKINAHKSMKVYNKMLSQEEKDIQETVARLAKYINS